MRFTTVEGACAPVQLIQKCRDLLLDPSATRGGHAGARSASEGALLCHCLRRRNRLTESSNLYKDPLGPLSEDLECSRMFQ